LFREYVRTITECQKSLVLSYSYKLFCIKQFNLERMCVTTVSLPRDFCRE